MSQLNKLTYGNKTDPIPVVDRLTQATAADFNDIKTIVNAAVDGINQIKSDEANLVSGDNIVEFIVAYPDGLPFVITVLSCINNNGYIVGYTISNKTKDGFTVNVGQSCSLTYLAVPQR